MTLQENNKTRECNDRRLGVERRQFSYDDYYPERRNGKERRLLDRDGRAAPVERDNA